VASNGSRTLQHLASNEVKSHPVSTYPHPQLNHRFYPLYWNVDFEGDMEAVAADADWVLSGVGEFIVADSHYGLVAHLP
jgi:hypothetical protein